MLMKRADMDARRRSWIGCTLRWRCRPLPAVSSRCLCLALLLPPPLHGAALPSAAPVRQACALPGDGARCCTASAAALVACSWL